MLHCYLHTSNPEDRPSSSTDTPQQACNQEGERASKQTAFKALKTFLEGVDHAAQSRGSYNRHSRAVIKGRAAAGEITPHERQTARRSLGSVPGAGTLTITQEWWRALTMTEQSAAETIKQQVNLQGCGCLLLNYRWFSAICELFE